MATKMILAAATAALLAIGVGRPAAAAAVPCEALDVEISGVDTDLRCTQERVRPEEPRDRIEIEVLRGRDDESLWAVVLFRAADHGNVGGIGLADAYAMFGMTAGAGRIDGSRGETPEGDQFESFAPEGASCFVFQRPARQTVEGWDLLLGIRCVEGRRGPFAQAEVRPALARIAID